MRNCKKCGKFSRTVTCKSCKRQAELESLVQRQVALIRVAEDRAKSLENRIRAMRRYRVRPNTEWCDQTWDEAVKLAESLYRQGHHYVQIVDEKGRIIRKWEPAKSEVLLNSP